MNERGQDILTDKAFAVIRREKMLHNGQNILVALSGGADSMALLNFLLAERDILSLGSITAAHINHGLRGEEAARDEAFVRKQCEYLDVPLFVYCADVKGEAEAFGEGIEEAGRRIRYAILAEQAAKFDAVIATAHTLSDSMETVLFHIARGCGLRGLCGIPSVREFVNGTVHAVTVRPLIDCTRADVEMYCTQHEIPFVNDSTNSNTEFARNRIRHCIIPQLAEINPSVESAFLRLINHAREDAVLLDKLAQAALHESELKDGRDGYDTDQLKKLSPAIRIRVLEAIVHQKIKCGITDRQFEVMDHLLYTGGALMLNETTRIRVSQGRFAVLCEEKNKMSEDFSKEIVIEPGISCAFYGRIYIPRLLSLDDFEKQKKINKNLLKNALNYDKITGNLILRARKPGDAYHPAGRGVKKTLKKLLGEAKVPAEQRNSVPVLCDANGIVLVCGFGCDERVRIEQTACRVLVLQTV